MIAPPPPPPSGSRLGPLRAEGRHHLIHPGEKNLHTIAGEKRARTASAPSPAHPAEDRAGKTSRWPAPPARPKRSSASGAAGAAGGAGGRGAADGERELRSEPASSRPEGWRIHGTCARGERQQHGTDARRAERVDPRRAGSGDAQRAGIIQPGTSAAGVGGSRGVGDRWRERHHGLELRIDSNFVRHARNTHPNLTDEDFHRIPELMHGAHTIAASETDRKLPAVEFQQRSAERDHLLIGATLNKRGHLQMTTLKKSTENRAA